MPPALSCPCPPSSFTLLCLPARKGRRRALALGPSPRSPCRAPGHPYGRRVSIAASSGRYGHSSSPRAFLLGGGGASEWGLDVQVEKEGQVWGKGGLAYMATSTALAGAASWACRGHKAQSRKATQSPQPQSSEKQELPQLPCIWWKQSWSSASPAAGPS